MSWRSAGPALLLALLGLLAWALEPLLPLESSIGPRLLFTARGAVPPPDEVLVVAIDERSASAFGLPERPRQWPRSRHAELVAQLHAAGARLVAFDLTFESATADDDAFARSLQLAGNVLLTSSLRTDVWRSGGAQAVVEQVRPSVWPIGEAAREHAPFVLPKDARVDAYWTFRRGADHMPSLPVLAFHLFHPTAVDALVGLSCRAQPTADCAGPLATPLADAAQPAARLRWLRERFVRWPGHAAAVQRLLPSALEAPPQVATLVALHAGGDVAHLNFHGPARSIRTVAYADVARLAREQPSLFAGRMVFVGFSAESSGAQDRLRDDYRTVFSDESGVDVSGVEIAATAFANLQQGRPLMPLAPAAAAMLVAGWGLLLGLLSAWRARWWPGLLMALLPLALAACGLVAFTRQAQWWPLVVPLLVQWPVAVGLLLWLRMRHSRRERDRMHQAFAHFVPRGVAEQLAQAPAHIAAAHRVGFGVCMATDAVQYSALAERMDPQALGETLNAYYARLFEPVARHGGWVIDVVGDAMLALWESPPDDPAARSAACHAALAIQAALAQEPPGSPAALPTRIGLHCGDMRIGTVGARTHYEFRAVGDAVNIASRLEGLNKLLGTRVLASAEMAAGLRHLFVLRPVGSFVLTGKREPVDVVEVMALAGPASAALDGRLTAFADALAAYRQGDASLAMSGFEALLRQWPDDGPCAYYFAQCRHLLSDPQHHDPKLPIQVAAK
ncbi:CHASE2 domain-containing protein [Aquincola sp. J276]|uniref:CHASE2 domain-containing protein n=1 Tax=Aquincola sp. J276 TaxID=2898432 RepID=UPI0021514696|nr:adenylate/guanylate cyclase domain-containing protein [Aquincola sp. J276]MCR5865915.1 adenylate/guanylate cyclase domain-containing protein [Aquincola sp. J276]